MAPAGPDYGAQRFTNSYQGEKMATKEQQAAAIDMLVEKYPNLEARGAMLGRVLRGIDKLGYGLEARLAEVMAFTSGQNSHLVEYAVGKALKEIEDLKQFHDVLVAHPAVQSTREALVRMRERKSSEKINDALKSVLDDVRARHPGLDVTVIEAMFPEAGKL